MKKNIPYMPAYTSPRAAFAVDRVRCANSLQRQHRFLRPALGGARTSRAEHHAGDQRADRQRAGPTRRRGLDETEHDARSCRRSR